MFFIGGCSGSTSGGIKVIRWVILAKKARVEMLKMIHPHGVFSVRVNGSPGREDLVLNIAPFVFLYFCLAFISTFAGTLGGLSVFESFTASFSMLGNIGPAFGPFMEYNWIPSFLKWIFSFMMIAGRLEICNLIILFTKDFWKN